MSTLDSLRESGVVAVLRGADPRTVLDTAEALLAGGVTAIEVTADATGSTEMIRNLATELDGEAVVGAGTVLDAPTAQSAIAAGAEFVVSPSFHEEVVATCNRYGVLAAPGVMTPTEAVEAYEAGADVAKVFPAATLGPEHLAAMRGPLPQIPLLPTGGVTAENAGDYVEAGAVAVGAGSALVDRDAVAAGEFDAVTERARTFRAAVDDAR